MNTDSLNDLWQSAPNRPEADAGQRLAAHFVSRLRRRRRFQAGWLAWTCTLMTITSVLTVSHVARNGFESVRGQWAPLFMLALPWLAVAYFLRAFIRQGAASGVSAQPLRAVLAAAQVSNAAERRHLCIVGGLFAVMAPVAALAVWQLRVAGKVPGNQVWSIGIAFGVIFGLGAIGLMARYRRQLAPEQRTIQARLRELDAPFAS
jgi:hypothetical protein